MKGRYIYLLISIILSIVFININIYFCIGLVFMYSIFLFRKCGIPFALFNLLFFSFFCIYRINEKPNCDIGYVDYECQVKEAKEKYLIVEHDDILYIVYVDNSEELYQVKNSIEIKGNVSELENDLEIDTFEFKDYLKNKRVFYELDDYEILFHSHEKKLSKRIINLLTNKLSGSSEAMTKMLLFNDKTADSDTYENLKNLNAIHLFVVSGFHISFLYSLVCKFFKKDSKVGSIIAFIICFIYIFILDFSISSTRALISLFLSKYFKRYFNHIDSIALPAILFLFIEPLNVFNYSYILTFLMSFSMIFISSIIKKYNKFVQLIIRSIICFLLIIPIQLLLNYSINYISLVSNILLSYVVTILFVLCVIGIPLSLINGDLFGKIYSLFNSGIEYISNFNTNVIIGEIPYIVLILYYVFIIFLLIGIEWKNKKRIVSSFLPIVICLLCLYYRKEINSFQIVTFLNVYQGDCTIIQDCYSDKVMMIDTGGLTYYDIAENKIMPYLKCHGIRKIDIVVATHNDYDHCGALESLESLIQIDTVITNAEEVYNVDLGNIHLKNLNHYYTEESEENNKSIVLYGEINSLYYLFAADMPMLIENYIIRDNPDLKVDVLKVGHHGSNTSSGENFISTIQPKYSIISVGHNNKYGHPHQVTLDTLEKYNSKIYRTDINGTIRFKGNLNDFYYIETAK